VNLEQGDSAKGFHFVHFHIRFCSFLHFTWHVVKATGILIVLSFKLTSDKHNFAGPWLRWTQPTSNCKIQRRKSSDGFAWLAAGNVTWLELSTDVPRRAHHIKRVIMATIASPLSAAHLQIIRSC